MAKLPRPVAQLLEELEANPEKVGTRTGSMCTITVGPKTFELKPAECQKLLQSLDTVDKLFEALGSPKEAYIELVDVNLECDVGDRLDELFSTE